MANLARCVKLNNGMLMPALGLGTWKLNGEHVPDLVRPNFFNFFFNRGFENNILV